jgi:sugar transferase (PEP-CTERM/EpsH1 system associated)
MPRVDDPDAASATPEVAQCGVSSPIAHKIRHTRLRVLHVLGRIDVGGTELNVRKLVQGLSEELYDHRICAIRGASLSAGQEWCAGMIPVFSGANENGPQLAVARLARIMRAFRPHIVHSRNWGAIEAVTAARLARVPVAIHSEHGYEINMFDGLPLRRRVFRRFSYGLADAVFAVTRELRDYHARQAWVSPGRIRVIYNGVDTDRFQPRPDLRAALRKRLELPAESFVVGSVGRLVRIKDYPTLFAAVTPLLGCGIEARILLVGTGPELEPLKAKVNASPLNGKVIFMGLSHNVSQLMAALDVFVLPSLREGMSNTLLEAMASGLPVIATKVGGNPEIVEDGHSGILVPPGNSAEMSAWLQRLAASPDLRHQLGSAARRHILSRFTLARMLGEYDHLYQELAEARRLRPPA